MVGKFKMESDVLKALYTYTHKKNTNKEGKKNNWKLKKIKTLRFQFKWISTCCWIPKFS